MKKPALTRRSVSAKLCRHTHTHASAYHDHHGLSFDPQLRAGTAYSMHSPWTVPTVTLLATTDGCMQLLTPSDSSLCRRIGDSSLDKVPRQSLSPDGVSLWRDLRCRYVRHFPLADVAGGVAECTQSLAHNLVATPTVRDD
jgi:hypothetical protein